jgi:putative holliday junction resolvase
MRVAALDYGKVRIGVAVSDDLGMLAHPRPAIDARNRKEALAAIRDLAREEALTRIIVGMPLNMKGEATASADAAIAFAQGVAEITNLEVELWDERLSTVEAQRQLHASGLNAKQSRGKIDSAAACVVLQAWMESQHTRARNAGDALGGPGAPPASAGRANERGARRSR